jgi:hypothetical protein
LNGVSGTGNGFDLQTEEKCYNIQPPNKFFRSVANIKYSVLSIIQGNGADGGVWMFEECG